jgi:hypothetical protein
MARQACDHAGRVEEDDPLNVRRRAGIDQGGKCFLGPQPWILILHPCRHGKQLALDLFGDRQEQTFLAGKVVVDRARRHPGFRHDRLQADGVEAQPAKLLTTGAQQRVDGRLRMTFSQRFHEPA